MCYYIFTAFEYEVRQDSTFIYIKPIIVVRNMLGI